MPSGICIGSAHYLSGEREYSFPNPHGVPTQVTAFRMSLEQAAGKTYDVYLTDRMFDDRSPDFDSATIVTGVKFDGSGTAKVTLQTPLDMSAFPVSLNETLHAVYLKSVDENPDISDCYVTARYCPEFMLGMLDTADAGAVLANGQQLIYTSGPGNAVLKLRFQGTRLLNVSDLAPTYSLAVNLLATNNSNTIISITPAAHVSRTRVPAALLVGEYSLEFSFSRANKKYVILSYWYADTICPGKNATIVMPDIVLNRS